MATEFKWDVFLSYSTKDSRVARALAKRLRSDGLRVWFAEWELGPGDPILAKIDDGLDRSRVLLLCMSANAFGSEWATLESHTFRFRDPLNKDRRFIPLRLDEGPIKASVAQFLYISWLAPDRKFGYRKLLAACRPEMAEFAREEQPARTRIGHTGHHILLVEDAAEVSWMLKGALEHAGYGVVYARNARDGTSAWRRGDISCLIVDLDLGRAIGEVGEQVAAVSAKLEGWEWLRDVVFAETPSFRTRTVIFSDYAPQLRDATTEEDLEGIRIIEKRDPNCTRELMLAVECIMNTDS